MNMLTIIAEVKKITDSVREKSNRAYPLFRNLHEAHNVIKEELEEADYNRECVIDNFERIWRCTRTDNISSAIASAKATGKMLDLQIAELIQAKAMCDKLVESETKIRKFYEYAETKMEQYEKEK